MRVFCHFRVGQGQLPGHVQPVQSHKVHSQKNPGFGLMLCCHHLEILRIFEKIPHFHVSLDLKNSVADSETSQNLVDGCIRHLVSTVLNLFTAKNECMVCLVPSTLGLHSMPVGT